MVFTRGRRIYESGFLSQFQRHVPKAANQTETRGSLALAAEWVAPIIAWLMIILLALAIAGMLLGEE